MEVVHKEYSSTSNSSTSDSGRGDTCKQASPRRKQSRKALKRGNNRRGRRRGWRRCLEAVKLQNALIVRMIVALTDNGDGFIRSCPAG